MIRVALLAAAALGLSAVPATAQAQDAAGSAQTKGLTVGATVYGPSGAEVGTIQSITGNVVTVSTGTNTVGIPADRFGEGDKGPVLGLERAQLDAIAEKGKAAAAAKLAAALQPGAAVHGTSGNVLGSVKAVEDDMVTLTAAEGGEVRVPKSGFSADAGGQLVLNMDAQAFAAAVAGSKPAGSQ